MARQRPRRQLQRVALRSMTDDPDTIDPDCFGDQSFEDALEPVHLIRRSSTVLRAGALMLGAGTSSLRVRELMRRSAASLGLDSIHTSITYTTIAATVSRRGIFRTQIAEAERRGIDAHRIQELQQLSNTLGERITATELDSELDRIETIPPLYPVWLLGILVALACSSVTLLGYGGWREVLAVVPSAALAFFLNRFLADREVNHLASVLAAATTASGLFVGFTWMIDSIMGDSSPRMVAGFICASIFLIPGFPLVTAGLDLTRIDLAAGIQRLVYAGMVMLAITIGVWLVATVSGISPGSVPSMDRPDWVVWVIRVIASFFAVFGWAMAFNSPLAAATASAGIAVIGNSLRLLMVDAGIAPHIAAFFACVLIGIGCAVIGKLFGLEKVIMTVPTLLVLVPGSSALQTLLHFDQADVLLALSYGVSTVLVLVGVISGLGTARMLTDPEWAFTRTDPPSIAEVVKAHARRVQLSHRKRK